ncbi:hypothetical protein TWF696_002227 [Orbilia brochopaga]|uniref:Uncharacterized protein n=1 Tax=Orbilia brochopaga TaxID=3140254 RepID=A0AAV9U708_9PEZI
MYARSLSCSRQGEGSVQRLAEEYISTYVDEMDDDRGEEKKSREEDEEEKK